MAWLTVSLAWHATATSSTVTNTKNRMLQTYDTTKAILIKKHDVCRCARLCFGERRQEKEIVYEPYKFVLIILSIPYKHSFLNTSFEFTKDFYK